MPTSYVGQTASKGKQYARNDSMNGGSMRAALRDACFINKRIRVLSRLQLERE